MIFDPTTLNRLEIDEKAASNIDLEAIMLYHSLP
jgi:hypothetical protein